MSRFLLSLTLSILVLGFVWAAQSPMLVRPGVSSSSASESSVQVRTTGEMFVTAEWFDLIFNETRQRSEAELKRSLRQDGNRRKSSSGTYRTLCVRLCDGFYFPVSESTRRERLSADAKQCEQRCPTRSRLFMHRNPGEDADAMVDLQGRPYRNLPTALLYQTKYVADCNCHGNPWDEAALGRHAAFTEAATKKLNGKTADSRSVSAPERNPSRQVQWARRE